MEYRVKLEIFEGPLDLLLHLIKKNEVDIYDIPISKITEDYLGYIEAWRSMDLEVAGEFIVMAATLMHIKSRMLLPIEEEGPEEQWLDPREELARKLLEYQKFKNAAMELDGRFLLGRDVFKRGSAMEEAEKEEVSLADISVFHLATALRDLLKKAPKPYEMDFTVERFKVKDKINFIMEEIEKEKAIEFERLFPVDAARGEIIVTFLAVLELCKLLLVRVSQTESGSIIIYRAERMPVEAV
jgi:segregation and condensation protein A